MQKQKTRDTAPERALRQALRAHGLVGYRKHYRALPDARRTIDVAFVRARVAVDVRGCFWHGCPEHSRQGTANAEWWSDKLMGNAERDRDTERRLSEAGWHVVVVWEHEDAGEAAQRVSEAVAARRETKPSKQGRDPREDDRDAALAAWQRLYGQ